MIRKITLTFDLLILNVLNYFTLVKLTMIMSIANTTDSSMEHDFLLYSNLKKKVLIKPDLVQVNPINLSLKKTARNCYINESVIENESLFETKISDLNVKRTVAKEPDSVPVATIYLLSKKTINNCYNNESVIESGSSMMTNVSDSNNSCENFMHVNSKSLLNLKQSKKPSKIICSKKRITNTKIPNKLKDLPSINKTKLQIFDPVAKLRSKFYELKNELSCERKSHTKRYINCRVFIENYKLKYLNSTYTMGEGHVDKYSCILPEIIPKVSAAEYSRKDTGRNVNLKPYDFDQFYAINRGNTIIKFLNAHIMTPHNYFDAVRDDPLYFADLIEVIKVIFAINNSGRFKKNYGNAKENVFSSCTKLKWSSYDLNNTNLVHIYHRLNQVEVIHLRRTYLFDGEFERMLEKEQDLSKIHCIFEKFLTTFILCEHEDLDMLILQPGLWDIQIFMPEFYTYAIWNFNEIKKYKGDIEILKVHLKEDIKNIIIILQMFACFRINSKFKLVTTAVYVYRSIIMSYLNQMHADTICRIHYKYATDQYKTPACINDVLKNINVLYFMAFTSHNTGGFESCYSDLKKMQTKKCPHICRSKYIYDILLSNAERKNETINFLYHSVVFFSNMHKKQHEILLKEYVFVPFKKFIILISYSNDIREITVTYTSKAEILNLFTNALIGIINS